MTEMQQDSGLWWYIVKFYYREQVCENVQSENWRASGSLVRHIVRDGPEGHALGKEKKILDEWIV